MSYTFQQGSTLLLTDGIKGRELLLSSFSVSQTYLEETRSVKTLHSPNAIADTFTNSKSAVSFDFSCNLTKTDTILWDWLGLVTVGDKHYITSNPQLRSLDAYILASNAVYKISNAFLTNLSLQMSKAGVLSAQLSAVATEWSQVSFPKIHAFTKQSSLDFVHGFLEIAGSSLFGGVTLEITREVTWVSNHSVHKAMSSEIYLPSKAVLTDLAVSGTITYYKTDDVLQYTSNGLIEIIYDQQLKIYLDKCSMLERWSTGDIYKKQKDFKLLPSTTNAYIQF